ncbi:hypothetical protein LTR37_021335 [Vermiconidia calcicola]|uniref:Uncharacterized protein n=1 Tax=Vermiconidia calcicola TaxID=1690605 RepID=A0ACC3M8Z5_9PEZI|nr:hypothetical protein LTR37_021335 [Vermiconidia calcicola]
MPIMNTWTCSVCFDEQKGFGTTIGTNKLCDDCVREGIVPQFEAAIKHEHAYPPKFGNKVLQASRFTRPFLGVDFFRRYERREKEYAVPTCTRTYCKNEIEEGTAPEPGTVHAGKKIALTGDQAPLLRESGSTIVRCDTILCKDLMKRNTCYSCRGNDADAESPAMVFEKQGLVRGREFQLCPKCETPIELKDGCNFIRCNNHRCLEGFCFICGEGGLKDRDPHWREGKCPRYNHPDATNAVYDGFGGQLPGFPQVVIDAAAEVGAQLDRELQAVLQADPNLLAALLADLG